MGGLCGRKRKKHQFVFPTSAAFVQTGWSNVLTVQVPVKLARETWRERGKSDVHHLPPSATLPYHPSTLLTSLSPLWTLLQDTHTHTYNVSFLRKNVLVEKLLKTADWPRSFHPMGGISIKCQIQGESFQFSDPLEANVLLSVIFRYSSS